MVLTHRAHLNPSLLEEHGSVEVEDIENPFPEELFEGFRQLINPVAEPDIIFNQTEIFFRLKIIM